jgi:predicted transcriptional regulator
MCYKDRDDSMTKFNADKESNIGEYPLMNELEEWKGLEAMTAADVMTAAPRTCSTYSTVLEAVMIFRDNNCGAVPILDEGKPVAILTDRDVALAISDFPDLANQTVGAIMTRGIVAVAPDDRLEDVCAILRKECVRRTLVVDSSGLVTGIIGWTDIAAVVSDRMMGRVVKDVVAAP